MQWFALLIFYVLCSIHTLSSSEPILFCLSCFCISKSRQLYIANFLKLRVIWLIVHTLSPNLFSFILNLFFTYSNKASLLLLYDKLTYFCLTASDQPRKQVWLPLPRHNGCTTYLYCFTHLLGRILLQIFACFVNLLHCMCTWMM